MNRQNLFHSGEICKDCIQDSKYCLVFCSFGNSKGLVFIQDTFPLNKHTHQQVVSSLPGEMCDVIEACCRMSFLINATVFLEL